MPELQRRPHRPTGGGQKDQAGKDQMPANPRLGLKERGRGPCRALQGCKEVHPMGSPCSAAPSHGGSGGHGPQGLRPPPRGSGCEHEGGHVEAALTDSSYITWSRGSMRVCVCVFTRTPACTWVNRGSPSEIRAPTALGKLSPEPGNLQVTASIMPTTEMKTKWGRGGVRGPEEGTGKVPRHPSFPSVLRSESLPF